MTDQGNIQLPLTNDEALVLYEFLCRLNQTEQVDIFEDLSEQKIL